MIQACRTIIDVSAKNPRLTAKPELALAHAALDTAAVDAKGALDVRNSTKAAWKTSEEHLFEKIGILLAAANTYRSQVDIAAEGDTTAIVELGLKIAGQKTATAAMPDTPTSVTVRVGKNAGEVTVQWPRPSGAKSFLVQLSDDPPTDGSWRAASPSTKAKLVLRGLTSGKKQWLRVASVGTHGQSPFSAAISFIPS